MKMKNGNLKKQRNTKKHKRKKTKGRKIRNKKIKKKIGLEKVLENLSKTGLPETRSNGPVRRPMQKISARGYAC